MGQDDVTGSEWGGQKWKVLYPEGSKGTPARSKNHERKENEVALPVLQCM